MAGIACASAQAQDAGLGSAGTGAASASSPAAGTSETAKQSDSADSLGDIVVTARRRDERLQTVPVSVTAFSSAALQQANVRDLQDLTVVTPGLHFGYVGRSEEHTSELQSLMRISYAVFCLKTKTKTQKRNY